MTATTQEIPRDDERGLRLSSLMDGELDDSAADRALAELIADPGSRRDWALWHAAGDALRASEVAAFDSASFAARVSAALANEPAIVAPRARATNPYRTVRRIVLPGVAAAAAVAALSWVALPMLLGTDETAQQLATLPATAVTIAAAPAAAPAVAAPTPPSALSGARSSPIPVAAVQSVRFDRYMAAHGQMSGTLGLARTSQYVLRDPVAVDGDGR